MGAIVSHPMLDSITIMRLLVVVLASLPAWAADEITVYDLLAPSTHSFDIVYDVSATRAGAAFFCNPIRPGSTASKEKVVDRASGKPLSFEMVNGRAAKASGCAGPRTADEAQFLRVKLAKPVPERAETRIRIFKTYTDPPAYYEKDDGFVFDRPLGIKRNVVILPKGYELVGSGSPAIVSTEGDRRVHVSFLNDREDQLPVKIVGKRLP